jgi:hypothetical protein
MKKTVTLAALVLLSLPLLWGEDCDCAYPIKPKSCVPPCRNALLMKLNKEELTTAVKLNEKTASEIVAVRKETTAESFAELEKSLPAGDVKEIQSKFGKLDSAKGTELIKKYEITGVKPELSKEDTGWSKKTVKAKE